MKKINLFLFAALLLAFVSCDKKEDIPLYMTYDGEANMTIAELLDLYMVNNNTSYTEIPEGTVITGIVTSCDKDQNCYQFLTIQDETAAVMISLRNTELYTKYPVGLRLYVECDGLVIGHKYRNKMIGIEKDGALSSIGKADEGLYLFPDGPVGAAPAPLVITSKNQVDDTYFNRLVRVEGARMQNGGIDTYCPDTVTTYATRYMQLADSTKMALRTRAEATFSHEILPSGKCNFTGILVNSSAGPQLYLRSLNDVSEK